MRLRTLLLCLFSGLVGTILSFIIILYFNSSESLKTTFVSNCAHLNGRDLTFSNLKSLGYIGLSEISVNNKKFGFYEFTNQLLSDYQRGIYDGEDGKPIPNQKLVRELTEKGNKYLIFAHDQSVKSTWQCKIFLDSTKQKIVSTSPVLAHPQTFSIMSD